MAETEVTITKKAPEPSRVPRVRGESREIVERHQDGDAAIAARLVKVESGGVDRTTGAPAKVYYEVTAKVPGAAEVTRTFAEKWNARITYACARHGVVDFTRHLAEMPSRLWRELRDLGAFRYWETTLDPNLWMMTVRPRDWPGVPTVPAEHNAKESRGRRHTRINSGANERGIPSEAQPAMSPLADSESPSGAA
jgi:hypothetical protein